MPHSTTNYAAVADLYRSAAALQLLGSLLDSAADDQRSIPLDGIAYMCRLLHADMCRSMDSLDG